MFDLLVDKMKPGDESAESLGRHTFDHLPRKGEYIVISVNGQDQAVRVSEIIHVAASDVPAFTKLVVDY